MTRPQLYRLLGAFCALGLTAQLASAAEPKCNDIKPSFEPVAASGVGFKVLVKDLSSPRGIVRDSEGNLLVVEAGGKGIRRVVLDDADGLDICVESDSQVVSRDSLNHGIALSEDGKTLFASSSTDVYAYSYDAAKGTTGDEKNIITGMKQGGHSTRTLLVPNNNPDMLIVSRGSDGNIDEDTTNIESARSQIRIFDIKALLDGDDAVQYSSGKVLGWGLRNSVGVGEDPSTGNIWSVENSIDNMKRGGEDVHNSNPGEEMNFHGRPNDTDSEVYGKNYGYPACVAIFDTSNVKDYPDGAVVGDQMRGDQMPDNFTDSYCKDDTVAPYTTFGSHLAPLDIKFRDDGASAFISFHGSWNRQPPNGYRLSCVAFGGGFPQAGRNSSKAEAKLLWNPENAKCPGECVRPVALAVDDAAKRLFMTSDSTGELFVVTGAYNEGLCAEGKNDGGGEAESGSGSGSGSDKSESDGVVVAPRSWLGTYVAALWSWFLFE